MKFTTAWNRATAVVFTHLQAYNPKEMASVRSTEVADAFNEFVKTGEESHVKEITKDEIKMALIEYSTDAGYSHHAAMQLRLQELNEADARSLSEKDKWKDRVIGFVSGIVASFIVWFITG